MPSRRAQSLNAPLPPPPPAWLAWSAWGLAAFFYLIGFFHRVAPAVITRELMQEFGIGAAALGHLSASYLYSYLVMQVPSGILADRLGPRRLLAGACLAAAAGAAVFALAPGFLLACLGRLMIGGSVAVAFVALLKLASHWMPPRHFALATGMALLVGLLGAASAGAPLRLLVDAMGWRAVSLAIGGLTLVLALAIWLWVRDDPSERGFRSQAPQLAAKRDGAGGGWGGWRGLLACRNLWLLTLAPAGMVGPMLAFAGLWGVPFLVVRHGLEQATAAGICSLQLIAWGVGGPLLGWLSDRVGRRKAPYLTGTLLVALTWPLLLYAPLPLPLHIALTLLNGLGTHRPQTEAELQRMLGPDIVGRCRCLQHDAYDEAGLVSLGTTRRGHPLKVNKHLLEADLKILTGFIEPHFFAGYSGGPKAVLPGVAGAETVLANHGPEMIAHLQATFGRTIGNPIWEEMLEAASQVENTFLVNVTLDRENAITGVFAGEVAAAHARGCDHVREASLYTISEPYDLVITTNSGYPLDQNLYQCVKGLAAAVRAVRPGGAILLLAACEEGLPDHGEYARILREAGSPQAVLDRVTQPGFTGQDGWQVQVQAQVQLKADVYVFSEGLSDDQVKTSLLHPCRDLARGIPELLARYGSRVCALPQGPLTVLDVGG